MLIIQYDNNSVQEFVYPRMPIEYLVKKCLFFSVSFLYEGTLFKAGLVYL